MQQLVYSVHISLQILIKMIRILKQVPKFYHNNHTPNIQGLQKISEMPFFNSYRQGINLCLQSKLQEANIFFQDSLKKIQQQKQGSLHHYRHILKKIAANNIKMRKFKAAQNNIYDVIKHWKKNSTNKSLVYEDYQILLRLMIQYDLEKAIKLGKALLTDKQAINIPLNLAKKIEYLLATAFLLSGNYPDAKNRLYKCLQSQPSRQLKTAIFNNLAVACWWHKNPLFSDPLSPSDYEKSKINEDFKQALSLLKKGIKQSEQLDLLQDQYQILLLSQLLQQNVLNPKAKIQKKTSYHLCFNLAQFLLNNDPLQREQIYYWLQKALTVAKYHQMQPEIDKTMFLLNLLTNDASLNKQADQLIQKYQDSYDSKLYNSVKGSLLYRQKKTQQAQKYAAKAQQISRNNVPWRGKMDYLMIDKQII